MIKYSESTKELFAAFAKFRAQVKQPVKSADNPYFHSKYVALEGVMQAIDAALPGTGLAYTQPVGDCDKGASVWTLITHSSGEWMLIGPLTLTPVKQDPQSQGSAITYAKRYQLSAAFGISSDVDDDGNAGTFGSSQQGRASNQGADTMPPQRGGGYQRRQTTQQKQLHDQANAIMDELAAVKQQAAATIVDSTGTNLLELCKLSKQEGKDGEAHQKISDWVGNDKDTQRKRAFLKRIDELNIV